MPIDYQKIHEKIRQIGADAPARKKMLEERRARARDLLVSHASDLEFLRSKVESAKAADANIRCASPYGEDLTASHPPPASIKEAVLIAADGSQINPDRHAAVQFGLINVGAIIMKLNSGTAPETSTSTDLLFGEELFPNDAPLTDGMVALKRDLAERSKLEELSKGMNGQVLTITDGPIELWGAKGDDAKAYANFVEQYRTILSRLQARGVITAGYVDKPTADLVIRLLEITLADHEQIQNLQHFHPLRGVGDRWLFGGGGKPLLPPGHRSAVFKIQSGSDKNYQGVLGLHFFYLNVGTQGHPWPVRVEIPRWVADDKEKLDTLHAVLVGQCRMMGSRPYPYLLHRAHETALVKQEEKFQIEQMLMQEMRRNGEDVDDGSYKQSAKELKGRAGYK